MPGQSLQAVLRNVLTAVTKAFLRARVVGLEHYPRREQRVLIVANHVSVLDWLLLATLLPDRPVFVIAPRFAQRLWLRPWLRFIRYIGVDPSQPEFLPALSEHLVKGERVAIFPEGRISVTGALMKVYVGPALAAERTDALILPIHIEGPQYSLLFGAQPLRRRLWPRITLTLLPPRRLQAPAMLAGKARRQHLERMLDDLMVQLDYAAAATRHTLVEALVAAAERHGPRRRILGDARNAPLSYRRLLTDSFLLADQLRRDATGQNRIALLLPSSVVAATALLAVHINGRAPVLLDPNADPQQLWMACRSADIGIIYTSRSVLKNTHTDAALAQLRRSYRIIVLDTLYERVSLLDWAFAYWRARRPRWALSRLAGTVRAEDPAVVLFTGDSQAPPKGVVLSHCGLLSGCAQIKATLDIHCYGPVLTVLPLHHPFGLITGVLAPLLLGVQTWLHSPALPANRVSTLIYKFNIGVLMVSADALAGYARNANPYDFFSLRRVIAGMGRLTSATRRLWADRLGVRICEVYEIAECSAVLAVNSPRQFRAGSFGRFAPGLEYYLEPVTGIAQGGRLHVRGTGVMLGQLLPEHPGELLPPHSDWGDGWYDSGDIVAVDEDGFVTLRGRARRLVKIGGETVSLTHLESLAGSLWPHERHVAITLPDPPEGEQLVLLTTRYNATRTALLKAAREQGIGEINIPKQVIVVSELPLHGSGRFNPSVARQLAQALIAAHPRTLH